MITISHKLLKSLIGGVLFSTKTPAYTGDVLVHVSTASTNGILSFTTCGDNEYYWILPIRGGRE